MEQTMLRYLGHGVRASPHDELQDFYTTMTWMNDASLSLLAIKRQGAIPYMRFTIPVSRQHQCINCLTS